MEYSELDIHYGNMPKKKKGKKRKNIMGYNSQMYNENLTEDFMERFTFRS